MRMVFLRKPWPRRLFANCKRNFHDAHLTNPTDLRKNHRFLRLDASDSQKVTDLTVSLIRLVPKNHPFPWPSSWALAPGYSFLYGTWVPYTPSLLDDGTDKWHLPGSEYKYRIWAGGDIHFRQSGEPLLLDDVNHSIATVQETKDIRYKDDARVAFVKIKRITLRVQPETKSKAENLQRFSKVEPENLDNAPDNLDPHVIEYRWLIFSKDPPGPAMVKADTKMPLCPGNHDHQLVIIPNAALLFTFSALTNNAHAIHLDSEYAKNVYGLPAKVVHGPLATHLMLRILHQGLRQREYKIGLVRGQLRVKSLKYTNIAPLYVDEEMKISCRKVDGGDGAKDWQTWDVWVSKKSGTDQVWKVAVRGVARVNVLQKAIALEDRRKFAAPKNPSGGHAQSKDEESEVGKVGDKSVVIPLGEGGVVVGGDTVRGSRNHRCLSSDGNMIKVLDNEGRSRGYLRLRLYQERPRLQRKDQRGKERLSVMNDSIKRRQKRQEQLRQKQLRQTEKESVSRGQAWELWDDGPELELESESEKEKAMKVEQESEKAMQTELESEWKVPTVVKQEQELQWERKQVMEEVVELKSALVSNTADFDEVDLAVDRLVGYYEGLSKGRVGGAGVDVGGESEVGEEKGGDGDGQGDLVEGSDDGGEKDGEKEMGKEKEKGER